VTFALTVSGTPPLSYQWSLDGVTAVNATNSSFSLINLHLPDHLVTVAVTNLYASLTSNAVLTVEDTLAPAITLNGSNPLFVELGDVFTDPGATAADLCAGAVGVIASGFVNTNTVGTNTLAYTADDGNGNTSTVTRTVIVRDTTPPTILWSFTSLVLAADTNCSAVMPDVTGTNFLLAADLSGALAVSQTPTNSTVLPLGTNTVVLTVSDIFSNTAYTTNQIVVQDQTPPVISGQPQSQTNSTGAAANFGVVATACTPLSFQWYFSGAVLAAQTNSTLVLPNVNPAAAGNYSVVATAAGGSSTSSVATLTVNLLTSTLALGSSENPSGFNDGVNFFAAITPANATGAVQFLTNGAAFDSETLLAGQAVSTNLSSLPRGTNVVTAIYSGDANDLPTTNLLLQIVTNHPPAAVPALYTNALDAPLTIAISSLATNWSDADGDVVSPADVGVSTNGITLTNNGLALVYFNPNNVADQFTCTITDGWGGTNFQTVFIEPAPVPDSMPLTISVVAAGNGTLALSLGGTPGSTCILEATGDLLAPGGWQPVATNILDSTGIWQFNDTQATDFTQRFYRLKLAQ
jgi:hypothetical protein